VSGASLSANRTVMQIRGPAARDLLAHLHPRAFPIGRCADADGRRPADHRAARGPVRTLILRQLRRRLASRRCWRL